MHIPSLSLARGFTVLMIAPIHSVLVYSDPVVYDTILGFFLMCIAEGPGAPLFMLLMGLLTSLRPQPPKRKLFKRAGLLLLAGYMLNTFKFFIPALLNMLPNELCTDLNIIHPYQLIFIGDILHFAPFAIIIMFLIQKIPHFHLWAIILGILIAFIAPLFWDLHSNNLILDHLLTLLGGFPPKTFFPIFPWLVYPLAGMVIGHYIKNKTITFPKIALVGLGLIAIGYILDNFYPPADFYRGYASDTFMHVGIVLITLYIWHLLSEKIRNSLFFNFLTWSSHHITIIYMAQWIVIIWLIPWLGYRQLNLYASIHAIILTTFITYFISMITNEIRKYL